MRRWAIYHCSASRRRLAQRGAVTCPRSHSGEAGVQTQAAWLRSLHVEPRHPPYGALIRPTLPNSQRTYADLRAPARRDRQGYLPWKILLQLVLSAGLLSVFINSLDKYLYVMARAAACWGGQMRSLCFLQHVDGGRREGEGGRRGAWGMGRWCNESCRALGVWRAG